MIAGGSLSRENDARCSVGVFGATTAPLAGRWAWVFELAVPIDFGSHAREKEKKKVDQTSRFLGEPKIPMIIPFFLLDERQLTP